MTLFSLVALCSHCLAQTSCHIDTVKRLPGTSSPMYVQSMGDTILWTVSMRGNEAQSGLLISTDKGSTFDTAMTGDVVNYVFPSSRLNSSGFDRFETTMQRTRTRVWQYVGTTLALIDTLEDNFPNDIRYFGGLITSHPLNPYSVLVTLAYEDAFARHEWLYRSTNGGETWEEIVVPEHSTGAGRQIKIRFSTSEPETWYLSIDGDYVQRNVPNEWYVTHDDGSSFSRSTDPGLWIDLFGPEYSVTLPSLRMHEKHRTNTRGNPVLTNSETGAIDTLNWFDNMTRSLFPDMDSRDDVVYFSAYPFADVNNERWTYSLQNNGFFTAQVIFDTTGSRNPSGPIGLIGTRDYGSTWFWIFPPHADLSPRAICIEPTDGSYLISAYNRNDTSARSYLLRASLTPLSVPESRSHNRPFVVSPNPASTFLRIGTKRDGPMCPSSVVVANSYGMIVSPTDYSIINSDSSLLTIDVSRLSTGVYFVVLEHELETNAAPFIINR